MEKIEKFKSERSKFLLKPELHVFVVDLGDRDYKEFNSLLGSKVEVDGELYTLKGLEKFKAVGKMGLACRKL